MVALVESVVAIIKSGCGYQVFGRNLQLVCICGTIIQPLVVIYKTVVIIIESVVTLIESVVALIEPVVALL